MNRQKKSTVWALTLRNQIHVEALSDYADTNSHVIHCFIGGQDAEGQQEQHYHAYIHFDRQTSRAWVTKVFERPFP